MDDLAKEGKLGQWYWLGLPHRPEHPGRHYFAQAKRVPEAGQSPPLEWGDEPRTFTERETVGVAKCLEARGWGNCCHLCRMKGHFQKDCPTPHRKCKVDLT